MRVVSLAGPKGSGKNALASLIASALRTTHRRTVEEVAFADPMRWACDSMGIPFVVTRGAKQDVSGHVGTATGRGVLIAIGETMRGLCPNFWADHMYNRLDAIACSDPDALAIVTDARRENEVDALDAWQRSGSGRLLARLWIERPGADEDEVIEASVRARCVTIQNAGTLADLEIKAAAVAEWMTGDVRQIERRIVRESRVAERPRHTFDVVECARCGEDKNRPESMGCSLAPDRMNGACDQ